MRLLVPRLGLHGASHPIPSPHLTSPVSSSGQATMLPSHGLYVLSSLISWWRCHAKILQIGGETTSSERLWSLHGNVHESIFFMKSSAQTPLKTARQYEKTSYSKLSMI